MSKLLFQIILSFVIIYLQCYLQIIITITHLQRKNGATYRMMNKHKKSFKDLTKSPKFEPNNASALKHREIVYAVCIFFFFFFVSHMFTI